MTRTSRRRHALIAAGAVMAATTLVPGASTSLPVAHAAAPSRFVTGWIPYWELDKLDDIDADGVVDGIDGLTAHPEVFTEGNVFNFEATGATTLNLQGGETAYSKAAGTLRAQHLTVFGTLVDHMGKGGMAAVLADDAARAAHVQAIASLTVSRNLDGIDIDYENFAFSDGSATWPTTQPLWVKFVNDLGTALHAQGKLLAVTVPAIWTESGKIRGYTVYDWANIIGAVDRLRIMVYDWSRAGEANAPMSWVNSVIAYTKATIPNSIGKVQLGVPTYGYSWPKITSGTCPDNASLSKLSVQTQNAAALAASKGATPVREPGGEMMFTYDTSYTGTTNQSLSPPGYVPPVDIAPRLAEADPAELKPAVRVRAPGAPVTCTVQRTVVYPDVQSVVDRAKAALAAGMAGIAIWALGYESPDLWNALAAIDAANPNALLGDATLGDVNAATALPGAVEVVGWAFDPEVDLPVQIQVSVNGGDWSGPILARTERADVAYAYAGAGVDADHGFVTVVPTDAVAGDTVCVRALGWGAEAAPRDIGCVTADGIEATTTTDAPTTTTTEPPATTEPGSTSSTEPPSTSVAETTTVPGP